VSYPPNVHDIKCYYISKELARRGSQVTWIRRGDKGDRSSAEGIKLITIRQLQLGRLSEFATVMRMVLRCVALRVQVAYVDEWLFYRGKPTRRLVLAACLKIAGVRSVLDERDPFIDFEIAIGRMPSDPARHQKLRRRQQILLRLSSLIVLPSKAYSDLFASEGVPQEKLLGTFRGVDTGLFKPDLDPAKLRARLGLSDRFVIGWFGIMHPYRLIGNVIIPMIRDVGRLIPNAQVVIGGEGPLRPEFDKLDAGERLPLTLVGMVPYDKLPDYISACDVLLCPVDERFRFSNHSAWLKIAETLAVGRPIIASRTVIADKDFKDLKGVVWVQSTLEGFMSGLAEVHQRYPWYLSQAHEQAEDFDRYSTTSTISAVADRLESLR